YIVDAMQGTIDIQSEPEKGTEFRLTFDFEKASEVEADMVLPPWNMLMVDDDELLCRTAAQTLKSIGINAEYTLSGEKAMDLVIQRHKNREDYQIILLDWKLPGMNGIQLAKEIRRSLEDDVPILLISAYDWSEFEAEAREGDQRFYIQTAFPLHAVPLAAPVHGSPNSPQPNYQSQCRSAGAPHPACRG
ncbi:MAG: hybrid sensor histidine kinase/response regulator, partial [Oscillospiraceae bacterium]